MSEKQERALGELDEGNGLREKVLDNTSWEFMNIVA